MRVELVVLSVVPAVNAFYLGSSQKTKKSHIEPRMTSLPEFGITYLMLEGGAPAAEVAHIRACFVIDYLINDQVPQFNDEQLYA